MGGNIDAAIEFLISEQETDECKIENDFVPGSVGTSHGNNRLVHFSHSRNLTGLSTH